MSDLFDDTPVLYDQTYDPNLEAEHIPLTESARRYRAQFPDVIRDPALSQIAYEALHQGLEMGMGHHEALPLAGKIAREIGRQLPAPDDSAVRSAAIAEIAKSRGQR